MALRSIVRLSLALVGTALAGLGCADAAFFLPDRVVYPPGIELRGHSRDVWLRAGRESGDRESVPAGAEAPLLHGVWLLADSTPKGTVVYCHGNDKNLSWHLRWCQSLRELGYDVLTFDPRGYGRSEGRIDREGLFADTLAAVDHALAQDPQRVVTFGHSLGGATALYAAVERPEVRGVIVESGFSSWEGVASRVAGPLGFLIPLFVTAGPDPVDLAGSLGDRRIELLHGLDDRLVPADQAEAVLEGASGPAHLTLFEGVGHRSAAASRPEVFRRTVSEALGRILDPSGPEILSPEGIEQASP